MAFNSVEGIMRDVNYGWLLRYLHSNGASMFFIAVYIHMFRGLYYGSYKEPREILWILGVIIYLLMMATGFMGYVLPWGQMSFWGATVITNLFSAIPYVGESIVTLLWGGYSVGNPTLNRFFSLHYLLPFVIAGVVVLHVWALHVAGQNNPAGVEPKTEKDTVPFTPYATIKDAFGMSCFLLFYAWFVFYIPNYLGDPDNYIPANPGVTPAHIVPEWYYLPFYAILRSIPNKLGGVVAMFGAISCWRSCPGSTRQDPLVALSSAGQAVLLDLRRGLPRPRLARRQAAGRHLRDRRPHPDVLLLRLLPDRAAAPEPHRDGRGPCRTRSQTTCWRRAGNGGLGRRRAGRGRRSADAWQRHAMPRPQERTAEPAVAEMVVRRSVRQVRRGTAPARLQGLQGSLLGLPLDEPAALPQSGGCRWSGLLAAQATALAAESRCRMARTMQATCSSVPAASPTSSRRRSRTSRPPVQPTAALLRRICR